MTFGKLKAPLAVKFLEKGSASGYPMIVTKVFEMVFEGVGMDVKLEVFDDGRGGQTTGLVIPSDVEDNLTFVAV
jgi:hypothetical protein